MLFLPLVLLVTARLGQQLAQGHDVLQPVEQPGIRGLAVAPGAPGFLVVRLHGLGQIEVRDEADIRLVDAHAEGNRGDHDHALLA